MNIELTFINRSHSFPPPDVLVAQQGLLAGLPSQMSAWKVIRHCAPSWQHPFVFCDEPEVSISDAFGNFARRQSGCEGRVYAAVGGHAGKALVRTRRSGRQDAIIVVNELPRGAINAHLFSAGRVLGSRIGLAPGQAAVFHFQRALWLGAVPAGQDLAEGRLVAPGLNVALPAKLPLIGVAGADIVLSGGADRPYQFTLQRIRRS
jgi:hypothetical protein